MNKGKISFNSVMFYYRDSNDTVFKDLTFNIDTQWKLGLIGRNGRGKTTLLNLINKKLIPVKGEVSSDIDSYYFPFKPADKGLTTFETIKNCIAPFSKWEKTMEALSKNSTEEGMTEFGNILDKFQAASGYEIDSIIEKEFSDMGMNEDLLLRKFETLSGGEQTRALIISLFLKKDSYPLIDEPTDHLDMEGREILGDYLSKKGGFIIASHDRYFLDKCVDHILSVNKNDVRINRGSYSQWKKSMDLEEEFEKRKKENLRREVKSLEIAARKRRSWSDKKEKEIAGATTIKPDKGYLSHKSVKLMKRALQIESRIDRKLEEKKSLLKNLEDKRNLKLKTVTKTPDMLLSVSNVILKLGGRIVLNNLSLDVFKDERVALLGRNGSGKTSLLRVIAKELKPESGNLFIPSYINFNYVRQNPLWTKGYLKEHLSKENIDETKFRNIMGVMGAWGDIFERPLETFSKGELKKIELCRSFIDPANLIIWDEPMNYLDVMSREQIESVILKFKPTMLFTEHDRKFVDNIATRIIELK